MPSLSLKASVNYPFFVGSSGPAPYDPEALLWFAAVEATGANFGSSPASITTNKTAFSTAFAGFKSAGIWDTIRQACFLIGPSTYQGALVNIKLTGNPTNNNFASGDYNKLTGLKGNGSTKYLDTNVSDRDFNPSYGHIYSLVTDFGSAAPLNNQQFVLGSNYSGDGDQIMSYVINQGSGRIVLFNPSCNQVFSQGAIVTNGGVLGYSRNGSDVTYRNDGLTWVTEPASSADYSAGFNYCLFLDPSTSVCNFSGRVAFYSVGTSTDIQTMNSIVQTLKSSLVA
jgi:hypothetical protein